MALPVGGGCKEVGRAEIAFRQLEPFEELRVEEFLKPFGGLDLNVNSIHMADVMITDPCVFLCTLKKTIGIASRLGCDKIIAHPSRAKLEEVEGVIDSEVTPLLEGNRVFMCWETFEGKGRFLSGIGEIMDFCKERKWHAACYDFSHLPEGQDEMISDIQYYLAFIKVFHASNRESRKRHLPLFDGGDLDFVLILDEIKNAGYDGPITIEYLAEFHNRLPLDALRVKEMLGV
ncbi:MAG: sugar phosphate isomerase/epimerase family protein [Candidatus Hydrothermarchaeaceae archaeon]